MPPPSLLKVGSGKLDTPCWRMQTAWASAARLALATNAGFWVGPPPPPPIVLPQTLFADT